MMEALWQGHSQMSNIFVNSDVCGLQVELRAGLTGG